MMQICFAPVISWALVFTGPSPWSTHNEPWPAAFNCFTEEGTCEAAAYAAKAAFALDSGHVYRDAHCEAQPPQKVQ
jgi:hypothetical protein